MPSSVKLGARPISFEDAVVLVGLEAVFGDEFGGDLRFVRGHLGAARRVGKGAKRAHVCLNRVAAWALREERAFAHPTCCVDLIETLTSISKPVDRSAIAPDFQRKK